MLLVGNEFNDTGIKFIPSIVTERGSKCKDCYLILREKIEYVQLLLSWHKIK